MEDTAERIVNRAINLGCQDAVADVAVNRSYQIRFAQNQVVISNRWRETTASAFIVYKKRVVASDIKDLTKLDAQVENLVKIAKTSQENPDYAGIAKGPFKYDRLVVGKKIADLTKNPVTGQAGTFDIVFDPLIFGSLIDQAGGRAGAYSVLAGLSPYAKKIGKKVASEAVTITDDGSAESIGRRRFDSEGVPTKRNTIIQKGILKTYLHNTSTAKKFKTKTTANAGLIAPDAHALFCKPGDWTKDEIFEECKDGLWLTNTWYTRYQSYVTGDFSTIPRDGIFRIKKGEVVGVWKDIRLTDNLINVWKSVEGLTKTADQVQWWGEVYVPTFAPYALARKIGITRSAE